MWNPETYQDTDYGLGPDEVFEPDEQDFDYVEPPADTPYIQTVLGRIEPDDAGLTLVREYLHRDPAGANLDHRLVDQNAALLDLETFFTVGGRTVVDATVEEDGRSAEQLVWLAQRAPVHIVASTGITIETRSPESSTIEALATPLTGAIDGTTVLPGLLVARILEGASVAMIRDTFRRVGEATIERQLPTMILTDGQVPRAEEAATVAIESGITASRIIVSINWPGADQMELARIARLGTYLLFDQPGIDSNDRDMELAHIMARLVKDGLGQQLLLSHAYDRRTLLTGYEGGPGLGYIVEQFAIMLLEAGISAHDVRTILLDNCASALTIQSQAS